MKIGTGLLALALMLAGAAYYFVYDGSIPEQSNYVLDIDQVRDLAKARAEELPTEIRTEILARTPVPCFAIRAGGNFSEAIMARAVFQIVVPDGHYVLETGMDRSLAEEYDQAAGFDADVWARVQDILSGAKAIMVTHEHPDHIGGIARHRDPNKLAEKLILTPEQFKGLDKYLVDGRMPSGLKNYIPTKFSVMHRIAPGIVMIRAPGHTPGSIILFVKLRNGDEYLFIGDIAYTESNVVDGVDRSRVIRFLMVDKEDRDAVVNQLSTIHDLSKTEPDLKIVPAHADKLLTRMIDDVELQRGFIISPPKN